MPGRRGAERSCAPFTPRRSRSPRPGPARGPRRAGDHPGERGGWEGGRRRRREGGAGTAARRGQRGEARGREVVTGCRAVRAAGAGGGSAPPAGSPALPLPPRPDRSGPAGVRQSGPPRRQRAAHRPAHAHAHTRTHAPARQGILSKLPPPPASGRPGNGAGAARRSGGFIPRPVPSRCLGPEGRRANAAAGAGGGLEGADVPAGARRGRSGGRGREGSSAYCGARD